MHVVEISRRLEEVYRSPRHGNKRNPLDELVYIILSQMTTGPSFSRVFCRLKRRVRSWSRLPSLPISVTLSAIKEGGLSRQKAPRLKAIARRLETDFGKVSLSALAGMTDNDAQSYLTSLPGVGVKTAKCVLMYALDRQVLPVDTHVARVSRRLGLLSYREMSQSDIHTSLERVVPPAYRYSYHVNILAHGRKVCRATLPRCTECSLADLCPESHRKR